AGLITLMGAAFSYRRARYEWLRELRTIEQVENTLYALVQEANQTLVEETRRAREDGKLTPEDAERIKAEVIKRFWQIVTAEQSRILQAIADDVEAGLSAKIEERGGRAKASAPFHSSRGA